MEKSPLLRRPQRPKSAAEHERLVFLTDSFRVYDAANGRLRLYSGPYGIHFGNAPNNTTIDNGLAYQASEDGLLALDLATGNVQFARYFSHGYSATSACQPIIEGPHLYQCFYNYCGSDLYCIDKSTGNTIWQTNTNLGGYADGFFPTTARTGRTIIVAGIEGPACFSKATGGLVWTNYSATEYAKLTACHRACTDNRALFFSKAGRSLYAFDAENGGFLWKADLSLFGINCIRNPYYHGDRIYITHEYDASAHYDMTILVFDARTGQLVSQYMYPCAIRAVGYHDQHFYVFESPAPGRATTRLSKHLLTDGTTLWSKALDGEFGQGIVTTPQFIYCISTYGPDEPGARAMNVLDQATGALVQQYPVFTDHGAAPVVVDGAGKAWYQQRP
ncbi:PQQ-binding-like beta-propeller repeat protein [Puia sp. P3]|uniref:outer membrane protein assembly factor BamB family protein n=1 Tax=Puia sp. P3 TaxID=3423952 RepID=UPI003D67BC0C